MKLRRSDVKQKLPLAVLAFACLFCGRSESIWAFLQQQSKAQPNSAVKLTTSIIEQSYCTNGDVRLSLRFRYTNTGNEPIILPRYSFEFPRYTVSRNEKEAARHHYELDAHAFFDTIVDQPFPTRGRVPPPGRFVVLEPGQSYEVDTRPSGADLVIRNSSVRRLRNGDHVLQISVMTWSEPIDLAEELTVAWREYGILWWQGVTSQPMPFKIEKPS